MDKLFVWFNTLGRKLKDVPQNADIWLSDSDSITEYKDNPIKGEWISFNPYRSELPLKESFKLPNELYLFIKTNKEPIFDWCYIHHHVMAVSEKFLDYLLRNAEIKNQIEIAKLNLINVDGFKYDNKKYFAVRIIKFDDDKFDFNESIRKRASGLKNRFIYPEMKLLKQNEKRSIYFLREFCYNSCMILTENGKDYILSNFHNPEIYSINDYPQAFNNSLHEEKLPSLTSPR